MVEFNLNSRREAELAFDLQNGKSTGLESHAKEERYCSSSKLNDAQGDEAMEFRMHQLTTRGFHIVWVSGDYCRAQQGESDFVFRWNGETWVAL